MCAKRSVVAILSALWLGIGSVGAANVADEPKKGKPTAEEIQKGQKQVEEYLAKLTKDGQPAFKPALVHVTDDAIVQTAPNYLFFSAVFRQFPVARMVPEPLKSANLFAVSRDNNGKVQLLTDTTALETVLRSTLPPVNSDEKAKNAVRAWLHLASVYSQDGFLKFELQDDSTKVVASGAGKKATGKMVLMGGGNGHISAELTFDEAGKLTGVTHTAAFRSGPRPICQATKLLDRDPIVRRMAEQDLLIMGKPAKDYLDEQRAKASPELQKAIDGIWQRIVDEDLHDRP